jgi:thioesterase domain-containing protein
VREGHLMSPLAKRVEKLSIAVVASRSNITRMNRVVKQYDPVEYLSPVLLFMAQTRMDYPPDPSARINQLLLFLKGEVETHVIQGEHMRILNEPGARRIAEIINKYINE